MKIIRKGLEIRYHKNGKVDYIPFVIFTKGWLKRKEYVSTYYIYSFCDKTLAYKHPFDSESEGLLKLNEIINVQLNKYNHKQGLKIIKKEVKYINE